MKSIFICNLIHIDFLILGFLHKNRAVESAKLIIFFLFQAMQCMLNLKI